MLLLVLLFCTSVFATEFIKFPENDESEWRIAFDQFLEAYEKEYKNELIKQERWSIFKENLVRVEMIRESNPKAHFGITQFMDLTAGEFAAKQTGCYDSFLAERKKQDNLGTCGTVGGSGCVPCSNDRSHCCSNCGYNPCCDVNGYCWSCAGTDGYCYPYDCGSYCSTAPCTAETDAANSFEKAMDNISGREMFGYFDGADHPEAHKSEDVDTSGKREPEVISTPNGSVDWVAQGAVTDVKNQGNCGSCWSFSTTGALEGAYFIKHNQLYSLSEQQLVSCSKSNHGCRGGSMNLAFIYTESNDLEQETDYPYVSGTNGKDGLCAYDKSAGVVGAGGYKTVVPNSVDALKSALDQGPVSVAIEADKPAFQFYQSGIIESDCGQQLDHGVLAVGYSDGYFKVKNSWGNKWGEDGFVRISDSADNVCGILSMASYPTLD